MSHEIYYTSAPEGMKRGASGFCTVAASAGIPRPLLERLEALSAYRHHFAMNESGRNPVSCAHWLLNVSGTSYHVLSRICDSGVDHTQRTNAFAHHLVLDAAEMAGAGPAWMLERGGVMMREWDGRVGAIGARNLPRGDLAGGICRGWAAATGDAGWGGHLADIFVKTPGKPVCILFSPGQDILPLIAESIALLPAQARWNVTFNTYFTSMPTSATCVWRCCLADTPAAVIALRYAAAGVVINLTDPSRMGAVPAGPYVTVARTGQAPAGVVRAAPVAAGTRPAAAVVRMPPIRGQAPPVQEQAEGPVEAEREEASLYDLAAAAAEVPVADALAPVAATNRPLVKRAVPQIRKADAALRNAESEEAQAAAGRRKQVMMLFVGALAVLGLASLLIFVLAHGWFAGAPDLQPTVSTQPRIETAPAPVYIAPATEVVRTPEVHPEPATRETAVTLPAVVTTAPVFVPPVVPKIPGVVVMGQSLEFPSPGAGLAERSQTLTFRGGDLETGGIRSVQLYFANGKTEYAIKDPSAGTLASSAAERHSGKQSMGITWKDSGETELATVVFDRAHATVEVTWKTAALVKRPEIVRLAYWLIQEGGLELVSRGGRSQRIVFKPVDTVVVKLNDASTALGKGGEIPPEASPVPPAALPPGWQATWHTEWDSKDPVMMKPETATQVLKFHKPGISAAVESWFVLEFRPGLTKVDSTFASRQAEDEADLAKAQSDLRAITADIKRMCDESGVKENDPQLAPYNAKKAEISLLVDAYKAAVAGYKELTDFDVAFDLADGQRITTVHFKNDGK